MLNDSLHHILTAFETHDTQTIRSIFASGFSPNQMYDGSPLVYGLINMYYRSPKFKDCMQIFVDFGLEMEDKALLSVLLDDEKTLRSSLQLDPALVSKSYNLDCTFTGLSGASLLHICAEYNHCRCAKTLIEFGADVNAKASLDQYGFGGQSPIFHTVNQHANNSWEMMELLVNHGADLSFHVRGLIWGKGYEWETFIPSCDPIGYAMMGLLRQFQRKEEDVYKVVSYLLKARNNIDYYPPNIPNKYLS